MPDHEIIASSAGPGVPHVGTYRRVLPVGLARMFENALDWAHLPHVHASTFSSVRCVDFGSWGWRAEVTDGAGRSSLLELRLDRDCRRWITRNLDGAHAGAEIWTHAFVLDPVGDRPRLQVVVDFFVPEVPMAQRQRVGEGYARLYERLYDEDVEMMVERQRQLDRRVEGLTDARVCVGPRAKLTLPLELTLAGREFVLAEVGAELLAYPARCPHQLGPLGPAIVVDGVVTCPWHGYRFDVQTGACVSGQACALQPIPQVSVDAQGEVFVAVAQ